MMTCSKCGRKHPMTEEDIAFFHPRFFCLSCGEKLEFQIAEPALAALKKSNDRGRTIPTAELQGLPAGQVLKIVKRDGAGSDGGG